MKATLEDSRVVHLTPQLAPPNAKNTASELISSISRTIEEAIYQGKLKISSGQKPFKIGHKTEENQINDAQRKLQEITVKKQEMKKELNHILQEENDLRRSTHIPHKSTESHSRFKSEIGPSDIENLKRLLEIQKNFEIELEERTKKYEERLQNMKDEENAQVKQQVKEKYERRKQQLLKNIEQIKQRRQIQPQKYYAENQNLKQAKAQKRIHQELIERWKTVEDEEERQRQQLKEAMRKSKLVDFGEIKEHEKRYQEAIKMYRESRVKNNSVDPGHHQQHYQSSFLEAVRKEDRKRKEIQQQKKQIPKIKNEKLNNYGELVRTNHKPTVRPSSQSKQKSTETQAAKSLSFFESHKKGVQYMRQVHSHLSTGLKSVDTNKVKQQEKPFKYKNYLLDLKNSHNGKSHEMPTTNAKQEIQRIMNNQNLTKEQKIYQATLLAEKIETKHQMTNSKSIMQGISAKLQILEQMEA